MGVSGCPPAPPSPHTLFIGRRRRPLSPPYNVARAAESPGSWKRFPEPGAAYKQCFCKLEPSRRPPVKGRKAGIRGVPSMFRPIWRGRRATLFSTEKRFAISRIPVLCHFPRVKCVDFPDFLTNNYSKCSQDPTIFIFRGVIFVDRFTFP